MNTLLILTLSIGLVNCGQLSGLLEAPVSGGSYSTGYGSSGHSEYNTINYSSNEGHGFGAVDISGGLQNFHKPGVVHSDSSVNHQIQKVPIPVPQPYKVHVNRPVPVPVAVPKPVDVPRPVPIPVPQPVPVTITRPVPVTIPRPVPVPVQTPVYVRVPQPVQVPVAQPYPVVVPQPYPVRIQTPVTVGVPVLNGISSGFSSFPAGISSGAALIGSAPSFSGVSANYGNAQLGLGAYGGASVQDCPTPSFGLENSVSAGNLYSSGYSGKYASDFSEYGGHSFGTAAVHGTTLNNGWVGKHNAHGHFDNTISQAYDSNGGYKY